jgi:hypothetical protein
MGFYLSQQSTITMLQHPNVKHLHRLSVLFSFFIIVFGCFKVCKICFSKHCKATECMRSVDRSFRDVGSVNNG